MKRQGSSCDREQSSRCECRPHCVVEEYGWDDGWRGKQGEGRVEVHVERRQYKMGGGRERGVTQFWRLFARSLRRDILMGT